MDAPSSVAQELETEPTVVRGTVKWFDAVKGYGFVVASDQAGDILLHKTVLRNAGHQLVHEGTTVVCEAVQRDKGLQAVRILELDDSTARAPEPRPARPAQPARPRSQPVEPEGDFLDATVKWFNRVRGYGFVTRGEGTQDIFIHIETLRRFGREDLTPGEPLRVRIGNGPKGPLVADITFE